ncbi:MAG: hypothetical protein ABJN34_07335 [Litoreibacter sp.]|uniref:hypothetical protein n=1 Tax=Litoreibacter sp. TaxID=1969459 RepID=UPI003296A475
MSAEINVTFRTTQAEMQRAMLQAGGQLQRRRPKGPFVLFVIALCVIMILGLYVIDNWLNFDTQLSHLIAFLIGMVSVFGIVVVNARLMLRETAARSMEQDAARGDVEVCFDASGVRFENNLGNSFNKWTAISEVMSLSDATALRMGAIIHPIPDAALPMAPDAFREQLQAWKDAA